MALRFRVVLILIVVCVTLLGVGAWRLESEISRSRSVDCTQVVQSWRAVTGFAELLAGDPVYAAGAARIVDEIGPEPEC